MDTSSRGRGRGRGGRGAQGPARGFGRGRSDGGGGRGRGDGSGRGRGDGGGRGGGYGQGRDHGYYNAGGGGGGRTGRGAYGAGRGQGSNWNNQGGDKNQNSSNQQQQQSQRLPQGFKFDPTASKTNQFERFIFTGLQRCPAHKLQKLIQESGTLWADCWHKAAELLNLQLRIVLSALARLPFSSNIEPPHIRDVSHGVFSLVGWLTTGATQQWASVDLSEAKLEVVELVEKLFEVSL